MNTNNWENYKDGRQHLPPGSGQRITYVPPSTAPQPKIRPPLPGKRTPASTKSASRMAKTRALALVSIFKRWIVMTSLVGFLSLSGLAALHRTSTTTVTSTHIASATSVSKKAATVTAKPKTTAKATTKKKTTVKATPTQKAYSFGSSTPTPTSVTTSGVS